MSSGGEAVIATLPSSDFWALQAKVLVRMKLVVLVPSETYLVNAGARIRYYRLIDPLKKLRD